MTSTITDIERAGGVRRTAGPLDQAAAALRKAEAGGLTGKIILVP